MKKKYLYNLVIAILAVCALFFGHNADKYGNVHVYFLIAEITVVALKNKN